MSILCYSLNVTKWHCDRHSVDNYLDDDLHVDEAAKHWAH